MMIEGGSRWGYDPIWIKNDQDIPQSITDFEKMEHSDIEI